MRRWTYSTIVGLLLVVLLAGCADRLVEVPTDRRPAAEVTLDRSARCPSDTVMLGDDDPGSGAGAIPAGFDGRTMLRCEVDYTTMRSRDGIDMLAVRQWQAPLTTRLRTALDLPDREFRPHSIACAAASGSTTALYVVDGRDRAVRVQSPTDEPCHVIRVEVQALLPVNSSPASQTFQVSRESP